MKITEIRFTPGGDPGKLMAYVRFVVDDWLLVSDVKLIRDNARVIVAFPSKKRTAACPDCSKSNSLLSRHCNRCGVRLAPPAARDDARNPYFLDTCHPVCPDARRKAEAVILEAYGFWLSRQGACAGHERKAVRP